MKAAFEVSLVSYITLFLLSIAISILAAMMSLDRARLLKDYALTCIENYHGTCAEVYEKIDAKIKECGNCSYQIKENVINEVTNYEVIVTYLLEIPVLRYQSYNTISGFSQNIKKP